MARRYHTRSTAVENIRIILHAVPWRLLLLLPVLLLAAIPAFYFGARAGQKVLPAAVTFFYKQLGPPTPPTPTPHPAFLTSLPQPGSILYTVQNADSCDEILAIHMHMADAGTLFSDAAPNTVNALDATIGQNCHALQPGMVLALPPQYPLMAFSGAVLKVIPTSPQQILPTPIITVTDRQQLGTDCSSGCMLTLQITAGVSVNLQVQTTLPINIGSWIWTQAMLPRMRIPGFDAYPYVDPTSSLNGMTLRACDLQVDNTHDDNALACSQLLPNTINDDNGAWLFGVTGASGLDHWRYPLGLAAGTQVLLWLQSDNNGNLIFQRGAPVYLYDQNSHVYVKV